jgi:8-oxo-dGTP pyrophosphatase MutT (NUDIX family)
MKWVKGEEVRYLLLKGADTGIWSFPKGHTEPEDLTPVDTAVREALEETSLRVDIDYRITRQSIRYGRNLYWEAEVVHYFTPRIILRDREHSTYLWLTLDEINKVEPTKVNRDIRDWLRTIYPTIFAHCKEMALDPVDSTTATTATTATTTATTPLPKKTYINIPLR